MTEIREEYWESKSSSRYHEFYVDGMIAATVRQSIDIGTLTMRPPDIGWSGPGGQSIEQTREFLQLLARAVEIAEGWQADTGRDYREVLKG